MIAPLVEPGPELTLDQRERYARHIARAEIGELGQRRLLGARVLMIGAGGLGSPALLYLAAAGVGAGGRGGPPPRGHPQKKTPEFKKTTPGGGAKG
ncbi:ThiF family adenylyltransferase, partial [Trueperella bernardiae]|uniref:ThiF family adenylyltransferase n=1 Tax=Trueperella bernardiae TaxID=59561 RepID=UPI00288963C1